MSITWLVIGVALVCAGFINYFKPSLLYWLSDQTNGRAANTWAERGRPEYLEAYRRNRNGIRIIMPIFLVVIGLGVIGYAAQR
jgi:hypothetical protein